jgi:hypothetical protein
MCASKCRYEQSCTEYGVPSCHYRDGVMEEEGESPLWMEIFNVQATVFVEGWRGCLHPCQRCWRRRRDRLVDMPHKECVRFVVLSPRGRRRLAWSAGKRSLQRLDRFWML